MSTTSRDPHAPAPPEITARAREISARPHLKIISGDADEGYLIAVPDLPGCMTAGATLEEAARMLPEAMVGWLESVLMRGLPVPEPTRAPQFDYLLMLQLPASMHQRLAERAERERISPGTLATILLAEPLWRPAPDYFDVRPEGNAGKPGTPMTPDRAPEPHGEQPIDAPADRAPHR